METTYKEVIHFWFKEIDQKQWWVKDEKFDQLIKSKFEAVHLKVKQGETHLWRSEAEGRLAEIIVLDQFSRNMYRDTPQAFETDPLALILSQEAIYNESYKTLNQDQKFFLFMPFMHSESRAIHEFAETLFRESGFEKGYDFELKHKKIIDQFGRYPHRNNILGRPSTREEIEFLKKPESSF